MDPYQSLFSQYFQRTPDGRYFVPVSATQFSDANTISDPYTGQKTYSILGPETAQGDSGYVRDTTTYSNFNDYFNALNPIDAVITGGSNIGGAQNALMFNGGGLGGASAPGMTPFGSRGTYNGQQGFFYSPEEVKSLGGINPATTGGGKPNDIGLWQALSILAPAAAGVGSFALDQAAASATSVADVGAGTGSLGSNLGTSTIAAGGTGASDSAMPANSVASGTDPVTMGEAPGNFSGASGSSSINTGGSMDYYTDPYTGDVVPYDQVDPYGTGVDQYGNPTGQYASGFQGGGTNDFYDPFAVDQYGNPTGQIGNDINYTDLVKKYGPGLAKQLYSYLTGGKSSGTGGSGLFGGNGPSLGSTLPGILALAYAARQPGIDTSRLTGVYDAAGANAPLFVQSAIDPVQKNIAAGYGDLLQSQGLRGIRGSSFGATDIANYMDTTGRTLGDVGATAAQKALGLQGDLAGQIAALQAKSQELKNNLYGRAFDVLGRGLNPRGYGGLTVSA